MSLGCEDEQNMVCYKKSSAMFCSLFGVWAGNIMAKNSISQFVDKNMSQEFQLLVLRFSNHRLRCKTPLRRDFWNGGFTTIS